VLSNSAFTQARNKLSAEVFNFLSIEMVKKFYDLLENTA